MNTEVNTDITAGIGPDSVIVTDIVEDAQPPRLYRVTTASAGIVEGVDILADDVSGPGRHSPDSEQWFRFWRDDEIVDQVRATRVIRVELVDTAEEVPA